MITAQDVNKLRQMTGAGMMDCKKALQESDGDFDKAIDYLRKTGQKLAAKRADRVANQGMTLGAVTPTRTFASIVLISCETDFVAMSDDFKMFTNEVSLLTLEDKPKNLDEAKEMKMADGRTVAEHIIDLIGKIGEKIEFASYECLEGELVQAYNHFGNKLATLVAFDKVVSMEIAADVAMQAAAMSPIALDESAVSQDVIDREREVNIEKTKAELVEKAVEFELKKAGINPTHVDSEEHIDSNTEKGWLTPEQAAQAREIKKTVAEKELANIPEAKITAIAEGRLKKFFKESTLVNQEFIKDSKLTVAQYVAKAGAKVTAFRRVQIGG
jgi:elongation factor Ts